MEQRYIEQFNAMQKLEGGLNQIPSGEPTLLLLDEFSRDLLVNACYTEVMITDEEGTPIFNQKTGEPVFKKRPKYPEILPLIAGIGHHEGLANYSRDEARSAYKHWFYEQFLPVMNLYANDLSAQSIIFCVLGFKRRQIFGMSHEGSYENFIVKYQGSERALSFFAPEEKKKKGILGWFSR